MRHMKEIKTDVELQRGIYGREGVFYCATDLNEQSHLKPRDRTSEKGGYIKWIETFLLLNFPQIKIEICTDKDR